MTAYSCSRGGSKHHNVSGQVDLPEKYLSKLDIIIASVHHDAFEDGIGATEDYTNMYAPWPQNRGDIIVTAEPLVYA